MFNLGLGELTVIALLVLIWAGPARLGNRREAFVDRRRRRAPERAAWSPWSLTEWLLVAATIALAATLIAGLLQRLS